MPSSRLKQLKQRRRLQRKEQTVEAAAPATTMDTLSLGNQRHRRYSALATMIDTSASATADTGKRLNVVGFYSAGGEETKQRRWSSSERQGCAMKEGKGRRWVISRFKPNNIYFFLVKINF